MSAAIARLQCGQRKLADNCSGLFCQIGCMSLLPRGHILEMNVADTATGLIPQQLSGQLNGKVREG